MATKNHAEIQSDWPHDAADCAQFPQASATRSWAITPDMHAGDALAVEERNGIPVLTTAGGYPSATASDGSTTRECPHVMVAVYGGTLTTGEGTTRFYSETVVTAVGGWHESRRRVLRVARVALPSPTADIGAAIAAAQEHIPAALAAVATIDAVYEAARARIAQGWAYTAPLERAEYESACAALGVEALSDADCDSYGVRYGIFSFPEYQPDHVVRMHLAARRFMALDVAAKAAEAAMSVTESVVYRWGARGVRYDEACDRCHRVGVVDNHTDLCQRCGPNPPRSRHDGRTATP